MHGENVMSCKIPKALGPSAKQVEVIYLLVLHSHEKTHAEIAALAGVRKNQLESWLNDPAFQEEYRGAVERWTKDLTDVRFANKKRRIVELERLYNVTPDSCIDKVIHAKGQMWDETLGKMIEVDAVIVDADGEVITDGDGKPVSVIAIRKMNVGDKAALLKQIQDEVEPKMMRGALKKEADGSVTYVFESGMPEDFPKWGDKSVELKITDEANEQQQ